MFRTELRRFHTKRIGERALQTDYNENRGWSMHEEIDCLVPVKLGETVGGTVIQTCHKIPREKPGGEGLLAAGQSL